MAESNTNNLMFEKLAEGLDSTSKLTHALLTEIRESEADFAAIKTELSILRENVKGLSNIVREGNGATSLLTKIALIEQRIDSIDKWMDNHADSHHRLKREISGIKSEIEDLKKGSSSTDHTVNQIKQRMDDNDREQRDSIHREIEITHMERKSAKVIREERQKAIIKIMAAIAIAVITFLITWYAKDAFTSKPTPPPAYQTMHPNVIQPTPTGSMEPASSGTKP
jgi:chromosome segregation ATPase